MKFKLHAMQQAFAKIAVDLNALHIDVHEEILFTDYVKKNGHKIMHYITDIAMSAEDMHREQFAAILGSRLPPLKLCKELSDHDADHAMSIAGQVITQIARSNNVHKHYEKYKRVMKADGRSFEMVQHHIKTDGAKRIRDIVRGVELQPGVIQQKFVGRRKLQSKLKPYAAFAASVPLRITSLYTPELVKKGWSYMDDYNTASDSESLHKKQTVRYPRYLEAIEYLAGLPEFYMTARFEHRPRMGYYFGIPGCNPHGKAWESYMLDSAVPYYITERGLDHIKHIVYVIRYGRTAMDEAVKKFTDEDWTWASRQHPMSLRAKYKHGDRKPAAMFADRIMLQKCYHAYEEYKAGLPTYHLFAKDLTNSGLGIAGCAFRSEPMMALGNLGGNTTPSDSHTEYAYNMGVKGVDRAIVKKVSQEALNGAIDKSVCYSFNALLPDDDQISVDHVRTTNLETFGECYYNLQAIAEAGSRFHDNFQTEFEFKTWDGVTCIHRARMESVPLQDIRSVSDKEKNGYVTGTMVKTMPLSLNPKGYASYAKGYGKGIYSDKGVKHKIWGLCADVIHSHETILLRMLMDLCEDKGYPFIGKHDNYFTSCNAFDEMEDVAHEFYTKLYETNPFQDVLWQLLKASNGRMVNVPKLVLGDAENHIKESHNFLMP